MKKKYYIIPIIALLFLSCKANNKIEAPIAQDGIINLEDWNFTTNGPINLKGEWKFKWMDLNPEFINKDYDDTDWELFNVPNFWNKKTGEKYGYACFRLKVLNISGEALGIFLRNSHTSYTIYINEKEIFKNGIIGKDRQTNIPERKPEFAFLPDSHDLIITWYISNFSDVSGGIPVSPRMGNALDLQSEIYNKDLIIFFTLGIILITFLYHLLLWLFRKKDKANLFFAFFCLDIFIRTITFNLFLAKFIQSHIIYEITMKLNFLSLIIGLYLFLSFLKELFPQEFSTGKLKIFAIITSVTTILILITPCWIYIRFIYLYQIILLAGSFWALYSIFKAFLHKKEDSHLILIGLSVLIISVINDIIFTNLASVTISLIHIGLVIFIIIQSSVLSLRFSRAYSLAEYLTANLQKEVKAQTKMINSQNKKLKRFNQEKTDFFVNIIHETKTPLTLISNYLNKDIKERGLSGDLSIVKKNIDKLTKNMTNFLDIEKINKGHTFYDHNQIINFSDCLKDKILLFREIAANKQMIIKSDIREMIMLKIDPYALDRILNNIMDNAIRYTPENGEIKVVLKTNQDNIIFEVTDNGIGIAQDELDMIFKPYYQATGKKSNLMGLGMGLSIVKKIIDQINGKIEVVSEENKGTSFVLTFRKQEIDYPNEGVNAVKVSKPLDDFSIIEIKDIVGSNRFNILIVEDNKELLFFLLNSISHKYNVYQALNGKEALTRLNEIPVPDLIISDIMMDQMDGDRFYNELIKQKKFRSVPFIFLTAKSGLENRLKGIKQGAVDFISKPFHIAELILKIDSWIRVREAIKHDTLFKIGSKIYHHIKSTENILQEKQTEKGFDSLDQLFNEYKISKKEIEIISLIKTGLEYKEISSKLNISINTVHTYMKRVFIKCRVNNKVELLNIFYHYT